MDAQTRETVRRRAQRRCEYCRLPDEFDEWPFHVDHIIALVHGGSHDLENLAWACTQCNVQNGSNFASIDPATGDRAELFNPRRQPWHEHFALGPADRIVGRTPIGRATIRLLDMNGSPQLDLRRELIHRGDYSVD